MGYKTYSLDELADFIRDSNKNISKYHKEGTFPAKLTKPDFIAIDIFTAYLLAQIKEAKRISQ